MCIGTIFSWIFQNKTWIFDGIGTGITSVLLGALISIISYYIGQKNCLERIIKLQNLVIDYEKYDNLTIGASGAEYTAPADGCYNILGSGKLKIYIKGICVQAVVNGVLTQNVTKGQVIKIEYEKRPESLTFYYAKEEK